VLQRLFVFVNGEEQQGEECWQVTVKMAAAAQPQ
jgi:hypothetical protein